MFLQKWDQDAKSGLILPILVSFHFWMEKCSSPLIAKMAFLAPLLPPYCHTACPLLFFAIWLFFSYLLYLGRIFYYFFINRCTQEWKNIFEICRKYVENSSFSRQLPFHHILITPSLSDVYGKAVNATNF